MRYREQRRLEALLAEAQKRIAELEEERAIQLGHDPLTGLLDLREFWRNFELELGRAERHERTLSLAILDLDDFAALNSLYGTAVGDRVLRKVGETLDHFLRGHDVACRAYGDEFAILLPETDAAGGLKCFERILLELGMAEVGPVHGIAASIGVAERQDGLSPVGLVTAASRGLDEARTNGGARAAVAPAVQAPRQTT